MEFSLTSSGADLEQATQRAAKSLQGSQRKIGREIGKIARRAVLDDVKRNRRGGLGFTIRGTKLRLGAKIDTKPRGTGVEVLLTASPAGPWGIVEGGAVTHDINPIRKGAEPGRQHVLYFNGMFSAHVDHPGTLGTHVWAGAEDALDRAILPEIEDAVDEAFEET